MKKDPESSLLFKIIFFCIGLYTLYYWYFEKAPVKIEPVPMKQTVIEDLNLSCRYISKGKGEC